VYEGLSYKCIRGSATLITTLCHKVLPTVGVCVCVCVCVSVCVYICICIYIDTYAVGREGFTRSPDKCVCVCVCVYERINIRTYIPSADMVPQGALTHGSDVLAATAC
jgi:hypothetical protein